jgi:hypothetical protein
VSVFEVTEPKAYHVGRMARIVRKEQSIGMLDLGANPHRNMATCFEQSVLRWAYTRDGKMVGMGGVIGTLASGHGHIWVALSQGAIEKPVAMIKVIRGILQQALKTFSEICTIVILSDPASVRFAEFLGFKSIEDLADWGMVMRIKREE